MSKLFLHLLNISITAGWIVLVVVLLRFVLKKAPKWIRVVLWGLVALRLMLPVSIESVTSLVPSAETVHVEPVTYTIIRDSDPHPLPVEGEQIVLQSGFSALNSVVNPVMEQATAKHVDTVTMLKTVAGWVWLAGVCGMLLYALISFLRLRHRVRASVLLEKGVYVCDEISDPFILGLIVPKIYLPSGMDEQTRAYVLSHERAHLRRFDFIWKPLGFLLLSVYWFNPLLWLAYLLLCRDIELACDEKVVKELDDAGKAAYSEALVHASVSRRMVSACPLAFGETGVKGRVKSVLNYKKPAFWIILVALLAIIVTAVCFLTMPKKDKIKDLTSDGNVTVWYEDWDYKSNALDGPQSVSVDAFPGVTFRWKDDNWGDSILAEENGKTRKLFSGMPVWNVFFADVTGDGKPELCTSVYFGSGIVDEHIVVYDYVNKQSYMLWDRGTFDYHLSLDDGALQVIKRIFNTSILPTDNGAFGELVMEDGLLCCHWRNDGSYTPLSRGLHESELTGEWLVEEETDNDGNVLYTRSSDLWKEYSFREDGTVTYNETVPVSSNYDLAFGHPVTYPYEVHDNYVYIAGDDTSGAFRWGSYDRDTRALTLMYNTPDGTVYAKLRRMGEDLPETDAQATPQPELTYVGTWELFTANSFYEEYSSALLDALDVSYTIILQEDGTGTEIIPNDSESKEISIQYTADGNNLTITLMNPETNADMISYSAVYDPQNDTLVLEDLFETYRYLRKGANRPAYLREITLDTIVGTWETGGIQIVANTDPVLNGTIEFREDLTATWTMSKLGGDTEDEEFPFTLDGNLIRISQEGVNEIGSFLVYDSLSDTIQFPIMNIGVLTYTRKQADEQSEAGTPANSAVIDRALIGTWELIRAEDSAPEMAAGIKTINEQIAAGSYIMTYRFAENGDAEVYLKSEGSGTYHYTYTTENGTIVFLDNLIRTVWSYSFDEDLLLLSKGTYRQVFRRMGEDLPETDAQASPQPAKSSDLSQEQADAFVNGLSVEFEDGSPYGCDLVVFIDGFGTCLNVGDPNAFERASLRYELLSRNNQNGSIDYAKILSVGELPYYIGDITVFAYGDQLVYGEEWNDEYPFADASILVPVNPLMMDRNQSCPERCCVIRSFDPVNRTVTVSFGLQEEMSSDAPGEYVDYASIETEQITLQVTDETFLTLIGDDYDTLVKPDRFFRFFEEYEFIDLYLFDENNEDASIGFWIGVDGDTLLYLCEMMEV